MHVPSASGAAATARSPPSRWVRGCEPALADRYLGAIELELAALGPQWAQRGALSTVYLGGGTPTMLDEQPMARLLHTISTRLPLADDVEITVECNPDGLAPGQLEALRDAGVHPHLLRAAERAATGAGAARPHPTTRSWHSFAVARARAAGFDHIGLDLILGTHR